MSTEPTNPHTRSVTALLDLRSWVAFDIDADGRVLAGHDELGSVQLVEIAADGGRTSLTDLPGKCRGRYVPGSRQVVVEHDNGGDEKMQLSLLGLDDPDLDYPVGLADLTPLVADPRFMHVLGDVTAERLVYSTNRRNGVDMDVVVREWRSGDEQVLYDGGGYVGELSVAHDGATVALTLLSRQPNSTQLLLAGPDSTTSLTAADEHALHRSAGWSTGDEALVLASDHDRDFAAIFSLATGSPSTDSSSTGEPTWTTLVADDEHDLDLWVSPDGSAMVVGTLDDGALTLAVHEIDGRVRCPVRLPREGALDLVWAADGSRFVVTLSSPTVPASLFGVDAATGEVTSLADGADQTAAELSGPTVEPSRHRVPTPDGERIPCFVYSPAGSSGGPDAAGASVLLVHGGPEGASTRAFNPTVQALVASGLTVLVPNVRGSTGYGKRWYSLDDVDLRLDSVADLAALHAWLPEIGLDPQRSALWGGSYGGYMVLAGVTMQPELWAAGVDIVGISSLVTFLENTSAYRRAYREREYGSLEHDRDLLTRASPLTYLEQLRAPLFVIHGANDPRVPLSEAEQIVAALAERGIDHELRVYADEGHGLAKRKNRLDAYPAAIDFLLAQLGTGSSPG